MKTLEELYSKYRKDPSFNHMRQIGIRFVGGTGNTISPVAMVVGEAPGKLESAKAEPFVGPSGSMLRDLMQKAGLSENNCYLTNVLKYRPVTEDFQTRTPTQEEVLSSTTYLQEEHRLVGEPTLVVTVGAIATKAYIRNSMYITNIMYNKYVKDEHTVIPVVHPAYIVRNMGTLKFHERKWEEFGSWLNDNGYL